MLCFCWKLSDLATLSHPFQLAHSSSLFCVSSCGAPSWSPGDTSHSNPLPCRWLLPLPARLFMSCRATFTRSSFSAWMNSDVCREGGRESDSSAFLLAVCVFLSPAPWGRPGRPAGCSGRPPWRRRAAAPPGRRPEAAAGPRRPAAASLCTTRHGKTAPS